MIGITKDGRLVAIKKNSSTGGLRFVGILITDPQELSDNYK